MTTLAHALDHFVLLPALFGGRSTLFGTDLTSASAIAEPAVGRSYKAFVVEQAHSRSKQLSGHPAGFLMPAQRPSDDQTCLKQADLRRHKQKRQRTSLSQLKANGHAPNRLGRTFQVGRQGSGGTGLDATWGSND